MYEFLRSVPQGFRKFTVVSFSLILFAGLSVIAFLIIKDEYLAAVLLAIGTGLAGIAGLFFKFNKDVHATGNEKIKE